MFRLASLPQRATRLQRQGVAHAPAKAKIETELAALMTHRAAALHDRGLPAGEASNMAKYAAAEAAVDAAIQIHGGNGVSAEFGLLPYWGRPFSHRG